MCWKMRQPKLFHFAVFIILFVRLKIVAAKELHGSPQCDNALVKPKEILANNKYGLWPGLVNQDDLVNGETLYGLDEVNE